MNAIVSYASSDSDDEINSGPGSPWTVHGTQHNQDGNKHNLKHEYPVSESNMQQDRCNSIFRDDSMISAPNLQAKYSQDVESAKFHSRKYPSSHTSEPDQKTSFSVVLSNNPKQSTDTIRQGVSNVMGAEKTDTGKALKAEQNFNCTTTLGNTVPCSRKDNVLPYIPKAKRKKCAGEQESRKGKSSNDFINPLSLALKKEKMISKKTTCSYHAPKRRLIHFDAHKKCINRISWNPCFQDILLSASMDGVVKIWNIEATLSCVQHVSVHTQAVKDAKWSIDGLNILSGGYDKFSRITDVNAGKEVCCNKHNSFVSCVVYHPSDCNVYISGTSNDGIFAWDIRTQHCICRYKSFFGQIQDLAFLPDGQSFISAAEIYRRNSTDKGIMVWDYKTSTILSNQVFQEAFTCTALQIHPNDNVFLAQCNADYIAVFSQKAPYKLNRYKRFEGHRVSGYHIGMNISPDGSLVASGSSDGSLFVYNYRTSSVIKTFALDSQPCMDAAWSPNVPSLLASCDWNGKIFLHR